MKMHSWRWLRFLVVVTLIAWLLEQATWPWVVFYNLIGLGLAWGAHVRKPEGIKAFPFAVVGLLWPWCTVEAIIEITGKSKEKT